MKNQMFEICTDDVIGARYLVAGADYEFAIDKLVSRISELSFQRAPIEADLYERLYRDILDGCIMPAITVALIKEDGDYSPIATIESAQEYISLNIEDCFILDGVQRLHTLNRAYINDAPKLQLDRPIHINYIIADSMDKLLYRMITLNNGQKPMSIRHQVEILADNMFDFEDVPVKMVTEKERKTGYRMRNKVDLKKSSVVTAYLAYMSGSYTIDNKKIVDDLLNKLVADKILSAGIQDNGYTEFQLLMGRIATWMGESDDLKKWFKIDNNLIAFCSAARRTNGSIASSSTDSIEHDTTLIEATFAHFEKSRIKMQTVRRKINDIYFSEYELNRTLSLQDFLEKVMQEIF